MVLPHRSRRESNLRKTPLSDNVWQGRFYIVFKGNVYFDEREQNRLVFKGRLRWIFQMLIVGNHHLSTMQHRSMFNYQRFSILIGTNRFLTKNSFLYTSVNLCFSAFCWFYLYRLSSFKFCISKIKYKTLILW